MSNSMTGCFTCDPILILGNTHVLTGKFDLTNVNNMAFYISGPKLSFETTEISTQQESNYIYLYTTKFGTSIKIRVNRIRDNESQLYLNLFRMSYYNLLLI